MKPGTVVLVQGNTECRIGKIINIYTADEMSPGPMIEVAWANGLSRSYYYPILSKVVTTITIESKDDLYELL